MAGSTQVRRTEAITSPTAEWRLSLNSERESAGYRRAVKSRRASGWFLGLVVLSSCPATLAQVVVEEVDNTGFVLGLFFVLFVLGATAHGQTGLRVAARQRRREAFRSEHEGVAGWSVDLVVLQGAAPTGKDTGVVWFDDDRLYFLGTRTSFGLARGQVTNSKFDDWLPNELHPPLTLTLSSKTPAGTLSVGFNVLPQSPREFRASRTGRALSEAVRGWMAASSGDEGQLPPLAVGPEAPTRLTLLREALHTTAVWGIVAAVVLWWSISTDWWLAPIWAVLAMLLLIPWGAVWIPRLRWQAWRDRRRLDRSASQ